MTPNDRKIDIMNKTYASNVQQLTDEIIRLKMKEDPEIDLDKITIPDDYRLTIRADMADFRARKAEADLTATTVVCGVSIVAMIGLCIWMGLAVNGAL